MSTPPSAPIIFCAPLAWFPNTLEYTWRAPNPGSSPITNYRLTLNPGNLVYITSADTYYKVEGLTNGIFYQTSIEATNDGGTTWGPPSYFREFMTGSPPIEAPTTVYASTLGFGEAVIGWTQPATLPDAQILWYVVTTNSTSATDTVISTNGYALMQSNLILSGLNSNSTYYFNVRAVNCPGYGPGLSTNTVSWVTIVPFSPTQLTGLNLWLDGQDSATIIRSGTSVTRWTDKSTNGLNMNRIGTNTITYNTSAINGYPGLYFTANAGLSTTTTVLAPTNQLTYYMVVNQTQPANLGTNDGILGSFSNYQYLYLFAKNGNAGTFLVQGNATEINTNVNIYTSNALLGFTTNSNVSGSIYINGSNSANYTPALTYPLSTAQPYYLVNSAWTGNICEVLTYPIVLTPFDRQKVEGYLAWKWGLQTSLPTIHPFYASRPTTTSVFSPASFSGLSLWLDGADPLATGTAPANGTSITTWADKSGSSNSGTLNGTAPTYLASQQAVNFSAQNGYFSLPISASSANESIFFVGTATSAPADIQNIISASDNGGRNMTIWWTKSALYSGANGVASHTYTSDNSITSNVRFLAENITSNLTMTGYVNGGSNASSGVATLTAGRTTQLGGAYTSGIQYYRSVQYMNEVLIYNRPLSTQDRQTVEGYLAWKWGLQGNLPSTHPYKYNNPALLSTVTTFSPSQLTSLGLWLDATQITGATNGQALTSWPDRSSNAYTNTGVNGPTYATTVLNGLPVVQFNGSAATPQYFNFGDVLDLGTSGITIFAIASFASSASGSIIAKSVYGPGLGRWALTRNANAPTQIDFLIANSSSTGTVYDAVYNDSATGPRIHSAYWDRSSLYLYSNATLCNTVAGADTGNSGNAYSLYVGAYGNGAGSGPQITSPNLMFNGYIGETIVYQIGLTPFDRQKVEGYLAWKWGLQPNLPSTHPFANTPPLSNTVFSPASFSGLQLWLDGADTTTVTITSGSVSAWADKSGNGYNATGTVAPVYNSTTKYVTFNGTNQYFTVPNGAYPFGNTPYSFFIVSYTNNATPAQWILGGGTESTPNALGFAYINSAVRHTWWANEFDTGASVVNGISLVIGGTYDLTTRATILNGGTPTTNTPGVARNNPNTPNYIGRRISSTEYLNGGIGEILVFNRALSTQDRQTVEGYLAWKWGLQNNLATTHPYYNINPGVLTTYDIVTDSLILYLDPGNSASYPGSGTTFFDLSPAKNHCTLVGSPTYSATEHGKFTWGASKYITTPISSFDKPFTLSFWVKFSSLSNWQTFFSQDTSASIQRARFYFQKAGTAFSGSIIDYLGFSIVLSNDTAITTNASAPATIDVWLNYTVTVSETQVKMYTNGVLNNTTNTTQALLTGNTNLVLNAGYYNNAFTDFINGDTSVFLIYTKVLTDAEVLQNYNAMKMKYT